MAQSQERLDELRAAGKCRHHPAEPRHGCPKCKAKRERRKPPPHLRKSALPPARLEEVRKLVARGMDSLDVSSRLNVTRSHARRLIQRVREEQAAVDAAQEPEQAAS